MLLIAGTAIDDAKFQPCVFREQLCILVDLDCEFTGGCKNNGARLIRPAMLVGRVVMQVGRYEDVILLIPFPACQIKLGQVGCQMS